MELLRKVNWRPMTFLLPVWALISATLYLWGYWSVFSINILQYGGAV